jgi:hypothetical protein
MTKDQLKIQYYNTLMLLAEYQKRVQSLAAELEALEEKINE